MPGASLTIADFAGRESEAFTLRHPEGHEAAATLVEVRSLARDDGRNAAPGAREPFALTWRAAMEAPWPQATVAVLHPALGEHAIFVVPVAREDGDVLLEAIFS